MSAPHGPAPQRCGQVATIATLAHDQGPWLLEWVVWHRLAGFDRVVICHAADDSATDLIDRLHHHGLVVGVTVDRPDETDRAGQIRAAINSPAARAALQGSSWLLVAEVTDFLHQPCPTPHTSPAPQTPDITTSRPTEAVRLLELSSATDGIALPAVTFGADGQGHFASRPVTERFAYRQTIGAVSRLPARVFARYLPGWTYGLHRPTPPAGTVARWCVPDGSVVTSDTLTWFLNPDQCGGTDAMRINRYPLRSAEEYLLARPSPLTQADVDEFARLNQSDCFDGTAMMQAPALGRAMHNATRPPDLVTALADQHQHLSQRLRLARSQPRFAHDLRRLLAILRRVAPIDPVWPARTDTPPATSGQP